MAENSAGDTSGVSVPPQAKGSAWGWLNPTKWIEVIGGVVTGGLGYAPREQVGILVVAFLVAVVAVLIGTGFIYSGNSPVGGVIVAIAIIALAVAMFFIRPTAIPSTTSPVPTTTAIPSTTSPAPTTAGVRLGRWSRVMVNLPIEANTLQELERGVRLLWNQAQDKYVELLKNRTPPVTADRTHVRANIFLPDNREAAAVGEVCGLYIPRGLYQGMTNEAERRIRFRTNEGLTGRVYTEQRPLGARRVTVDAEWEAIALEGMHRVEDKKFQLTQEQIALIDPEVRWIVSFPLKVSRDSVPHTLGVFNVDGLTEVLSPQEMQQMYLALREEVDRLIPNLGKLPQCLVTIFVDNLNI
jgi:hypothetical protein